MFVKVAPDLPPGGLESIVQVAVECGIAGLIVSNTTVARPAGLRGRHVGGDRWAVRAAADGALHRAARPGPALAGGRLALIGCGGVATGADVLAKLRAGAQMVQLYAAFAVHGPALLPRIKAELAAALRREGFRSAAEAVGTGA